jgi:hypothetical protein
VVLARGYGLPMSNHSVPVARKTVLPHARQSPRNILAAGCASTRLISQKASCDFDDDVTKYVPEAPTHGTRHVHGRQLLNHTSGIYTASPRSPQRQTTSGSDLTQQQVLELIKD